MSGLGGMGFVETAFLGPDWKLRGTYPASDLYSDSETAIWDLCPGCADERGWLEVDNAEGGMCPWMYEAGECPGKPTVDVWDGPNGHVIAQCHYRRELWAKGYESIMCEGQQSIF